MGAVAEMPAHCEVDAGDDHVQCTVGDVAESPAVAFYQKVSKLTVVVLEHVVVALCR